MYINCVNIPSQTLFRHKSLRGVHKSIQSQRCTCQIRTERLVEPQTMCRLVSAAAIFKPRFFGKADAEAALNISEGIYFPISCAALTIKKAYRTNMLKHICTAAPVQFFIYASNAFRISAMRRMPPSISPSMMRFTTALPTMTPSACLSARTAASGVPMPNPIASGTFV